MSADRRLIVNSVESVVRPLRLVLPAEIVDKHSAKIEALITQAIADFSKDKAIFTAFECSAHGKINPTELLPECPRCFEEASEKEPNVNPIE